MHNDGSVIIIPTFMAIGFIALIIKCAVQKTDEEDKKEKEEYQKRIHRIFHPED